MNRERTKAPTLKIKNPTFWVMLPPALPQTEFVGDYAAVSILKR